MEIDNEGLFKQTPEIRVVVKISWVQLWFFSMACFSGGWLIGHHGGDLEYCANLITNQVCLVFYEPLAPTYPNSN